MKKNDPFDFETAETAVTEYLNQLMAITNNEKLFIAKFNQNIYQPELLFDDNAVIERIRNHPLAVWKIKER